MKYREILLKIRESRKHELEEYESFLRKSFDFSGAGTLSTSFQQLVEKRSHHLILELPFLTDTCSINEKLVESSPPEIISNDNNPEKWSNQYFRTRSSYDNMVRGAHIYHLFCDRIWPSLHKIELDANENPIESMVKADIEDFSCDEIRNKFLDAIDELPLEQNTIKTYKCQARRMLEYCQRNGLEENFLLKSSEVRWAIKARIDSKTLASYFEYLERRCLKTRSEDAYKDLVAIRFLFYAPPTLGKLEQICLNHINQASLSIRFDSTTFPVPGTFIALAHALYSENEPFLQRNIKDLGIFVKQTSEANKMKRLTPTAIRQSLRLICHKERFIAKKLPRR